MKIVAEIPARAGSERVKNKNLRLLNGKPLISYAIEAAKSSTLLTDIYVNSDSDEIGKYGKSLGIKFYKRPDHLASDIVRQIVDEDHMLGFFIASDPGAAMVDHFIGRANHGGL